MFQTLNKLARMEKAVRKLANFAKAVRNLGPATAGVIASPKDPAAAGNPLAPDDPKKGKAPGTTNATAGAPSPSKVTKIKPGF